jgi:beta-glucanase (GH16 family)
LAPPAGYTSARLIFDDPFSGTALDASKWNTFLGSKGWDHWYPDCGGSSQDNADTADYDLASQVKVDDGLSLIAIAGSGCAGWSWTSGMISTYGKFEFNGGYVQVAMQAPSGSGLWPAIWLLPGAGANTSSDDFEIDVQEGGFTGNGVKTNYNEAWHLHAGGSTQCGDVTDVSVDLTAGYHVYGMEWLPAQRIRWFLDGKQIGEVTSAQCAIPDEPMELILNLGVGTNAIADFHSVVDGTTPTPSVMRVRQVQVYQ